MEHVTVKNLIAIILKYKKELHYDCSCAKDGILYLDLSDGIPEKSVECTTFTAVDGTEVVLDINKDGLVAGIEFC
jgi:hypothetical protein